MKKNIKLTITILSIVILLALVVLISTSKDDFDLSNSLYNVCFWIAIPITSVIIGRQYLKKHLWLTLVAVFGLDVVLWLVALGHIAIINNSSNTEGIALICLLVQEAVTLIVVIGIYAFRAKKKRQLLK